MAKSKNPGNKKNPGTYILGIGASAGGLDALNEVFENMPEKTGFSFIVLQHISPDHKSLMAELLARHTVMPVREATDGVLLKPNHIYLLPPAKLMTLRSGRLILKEKEKNRLPNYAIDTFFESLAKEAGTHAIGVILSGTGTDGTNGLEAIKAHGGIVVVQDPATASFDGMPNSAIATGIADIVSSPQSIPEEIITYLGQSPLVQAFRLDNQKDEIQLRNLITMIRDHTSLDFTNYKRPTLMRRLAKRWMELSLDDFNQYMTYIESHPGELETISKDFLINVSYFFRDKEAFDVIQAKVIPAIFKEKNPGDTIKVWSIACSTGEEAYSIAILFAEYCEIHKIQGINIKIFASDIDKEALDIASRGIYAKSILQDVSGARMAKFFVPEGNAYRIHPDIRKMVVFSHHNILKDPPLSKMDLIICRNMLIYINADEQKSIFKKLFFSIHINGYFFLGPSESISIMKKSTETIDKKWKIFKCVSKARMEDDLHFLPAIDKKYFSQASSPKTKNPVQHLPDIFAETLFETEDYAGIFVTPEYEVKQAIGNYKKFLHFPENNFNFNLMKLVDAELSIALSIAIHQSMKDETKVITQHVKVNADNRQNIIQITVKPFLKTTEYSQPFLFIILHETDQALYGQPVIATEVLTSHDRVAELEREAHDLRINMQALIEEMETANEELQAANEEMISSNEELQSTNEELQSLNEELHTISAEHQLKIKELTELNDDLNNYFNNSEIGQLLVDHNLIIRKFSPSVRRMFNLIETDVNRSILDITTRIRNEDIISDIRNVLVHSLPMQKEVQLFDNTNYMMRISPYLRQDKSLDGVVISFVDISEIKKLTNLIQAVFDSSSNAINAKKAIRNERNEIIDFEYIAANASFEKLFNLSKDSVIGQRMRALHSLRQDHFQLYKKAIETHTPLNYEYFDERLEKWFEVAVRPMGEDGLVTTASDITDKKKAQDLIAQNYQDLKATTGKLAATNAKLEKSNMDLMQFASIASHDLKEPLRKIETFGNILQAKLADKFENGDRKYLEKIIGSSKRMKHLIEDVLTFSKLSNNDIPLEMVDLNKVIHQITEDLEIAIREKNTTLQVHKLPTIPGIKGQLQQLFQNLISNALKFNDKKDPLIEISHAPVTQDMAEIFSILPERYTAISVRDNGIGFDEKFKERIFGIFQRLNGSQFEGTGIGLAICKKIVENHHGFIHVRSVPGQGTEFIIIMPAIARIGKEKKRTVAEDPGHHQSKNN